MLLQDEAEADARNNRITGTAEGRSNGIKMEGLATARISGNDISGVVFGILVCDEAYMSHTGNRIKAEYDVKYDKKDEREASGDIITAAPKENVLKNTLQKFVLATNRVPVLRQLYKSIYNIALNVVTKKLRALKGIEAAYLRRGLTYSDWVPGLSDIDILAVIEERDPEAEQDIVKKIWLHYHRLKNTFPMLGELLIGTQKELDYYLMNGDLRAAEAPLTWKPLFGKPITPCAARSPDPVKFALDAFNDMFNSYRIMCTAMFPREKCPNRKELFFKSFIDVVKCALLLDEGEARAYRSRLEIIESFAAGTAEGEKKLLSQAKKAWVNPSSAGEELMGKVYVFAFNLIDKHSSIFGRKNDLSGKEQDGYVYLEDGCDPETTMTVAGSRTVKWNNICSRVSDLFNGALKGIVLEKPGSMYIILNDGTLLENADYKRLGAVDKFLKSTHSTQKTPIVLLTDCMFSIILRTLHMDTPFNYSGLLGSGGPGICVTAGFEKWQYNVTRNEYGRPVPSELYLLLLETIAIINLSFRIYEQPSGWASKQRISRYFNTLLGLRLALEKKIVSGHFVENTIKYYKSEFPQEAHELDSASGYVFADKAGGPSFSGFDGCYEFLKKGLSKINGYVDGKRT